MGAEPQTAGATGSAVAHDLGPALAPSLVNACGGRLKDLRWFRTDWQRGGASTAFGTFESPDWNEPRDVVVKLPVGPREHQFLCALHGCDGPTPKVAAHGLELGGHDLAWVVMERLPGVPLSAKLHHDVFDHLVSAVVRFQERCQHAVPLQGGRASPPWETLLERAKAALRANDTIPHCHEWISAVKHVQRGLPRLVAIWEARDTRSWCHGDLHPGNCMERPTGSAWGPAAYVLLDLAEVHTGHWLEDAVYLERQFWGRPEALNGFKPVSMMAKARREAGLETSGDYATLANVRRALMAATSPAFLEQEGQHAYLNAALAVLQKTLPQLHV